MSPSGSDKGSPTRGGQPGGADLPETIGRYKVSRLLGRGGQGDVYLARHPSLDIEVAVKVLHPEYRTEEFIERFSNEARISARLDVRNIVRVYDFDPEHPYLVLEYCPDGDLSRYIKSRRRRPLSELLGIVKQVLEGLVAAHENKPSILHRDLKPSNVLFSKGVPKVADFGLAKALGAASGLTTTRGMMGTIRYCSPEQMKDASAADARTDLWSMGIILYEILAWKRPFDKPGDSDSNVMFKVHMEPPREPPFEIPGPLMSVINRALEKDREKRFTSAREMIAAISEAERRIPNADKLMLPPEQVVDDVSRMAMEVSTLLEKGEAEAAETIINSMRKLAPEDSVGRFWRDRLKEVREQESRSSTGASSAPTASHKQTSWAKDKLGTVESLVKGRDYREAKRLIGEILYKAPDNTDAQHWLDRINEEEKRLRQDLEQARKAADAARSAGDYSAVYSVWKEIDAKYTGLPEVQSELAVAAREKQVFEQVRSREGASRKARELQGTGDLKGAIAAWAAHLAAYPDDETALQSHQKLTASLAASEKAERLSAMQASALQLAKTGDLEGALVLWEGHLLKEPSWEEASRQVKELRQTIAQKTKTQRFDESRAKAAALLAAGDLRGAIGIWEMLAAHYPDITEARDHVVKLRGQLAEQERQTLAQDVERIAAKINERVTAGRYRSLDSRVSGAVSKSLEAARAALTADIAALTRARAAMVAGFKEAEATLARELVVLRSRVLEGVKQNRDWISRDKTQASAEQQHLEQALNGAVAALCEMPGSDAEGDPLAALNGADKTLASAAGVVVKAGQKAIELAAAAAAKGLAEARTAIAALFEVTGEKEATRSVDPTLFSTRLARLREEAGSKVPEKLDNVARLACALAAEAESSRVLALQDLIHDMGDLVREGRAHLVQVEDEKLARMIREVSRWVEPDGAGEPLPVKTLVALRGDLATELEGTRRLLNERIAKAEDRWRKAEKAWRELLAADLGGARNSKAEKVLSNGQQALGLLRAEELESWSGQLEGLARRYRMESIWIEQKDAVVEIEGALGADGLPAGDLQPEDLEILVKYRRAAARAETGPIRGMGAALEKRRSARAGGDAARGATAGPALNISAPTAQTRRLNEKLNPALLAAYDDLMNSHRAAVSHKKSGEAARLAADAIRAYRRLVQPEPMWKRAAIPAAALLIIAVAGVLLMRPAGFSGKAFPVTLISPTGPAEVESVTKDGGRLTGLETQVGENGTTWMLEPGHYVVSMSGGRKREFDVPKENGILLPGGAENYMPALQENLDLRFDSGQ